MTVSHRKSVFSTILLLPVILPFLSHVSATQEFDTTDQQRVIDIVKDELQQVNKQLAEKLILETGRRRRATSRYSFNIEIYEKSSLKAEIPLGSEAYSFRCVDETYVIQTNGIYRVDGLLGHEKTTYDNQSPPPTLIKVSDSPLTPGDRVLHTLQWDTKCFMLIASKNNTFSSLYTLHGKNMIPVFRQQIRNYGFVEAAKFFVHRRQQLYLIILNDNPVHSLTICPLFRWAGTYMDEIHAIQTRGASAVVTFTIAKKLYIAIAQSQDSTGNYEVGTVILVFDDAEQLEKLQVLWSYNPVSLEYICMQQKHYLVIGLGPESSITYYFAGIDFVFWQSLDGLMGDKLWLNAFTVGDTDPILFAATPTSAKFYSKATLSALLAVNLDATSVLLQPSEKIIKTHMLTLGSNEYHLAVLKSHSGTLYFNIYYVVLHRYDIAEIKETESKLTQCLSDLRTKLDSEIGTVQEYQTQLDSILTVDKNVDFPGTIIVESAVIAQANKTHIRATDVLPTHSHNGYNSETLPSKISESIKDASDRLHSEALDLLHNAVLKSQPGHITGYFTFLAELSVNQLSGNKTNLKFVTVNGEKWQDFEEYALQANHSGEQLITGHWKVDELTAYSVEVHELSGIYPNDFMRRNCPDDETQIVQGSVKFEADTHFEGNVVITPNATINGITFSDVVMRNEVVREIRGFKHTANLYGGEEFSFSFINGKDYLEWYGTVAHTTGSAQHLTGHVLVNGKKPNIFHQLSLSSINRVDWDSFSQNVLVNGKDQIITGDLLLETGVLDAVVVDSIEGVHFIDLLTATGHQMIHRTFTADVVDFKKSIRTYTVNGIVLPEHVVLKDEDVTITGPVVFSYCVVNGSIVVPEGATIGGQDVSELAKSRIKHVYYTAKGDTVNFKGSVEANNLRANNINDHSWETLRNGFWSTKGPNIVPGPLELRKKVYVQENFRTKTLNSLELEKDVVQLGNPGTIHSRMVFTDDVYVTGNIYHSAGKNLGGLNIATSISGLVRKDQYSVIAGKKYFLGNIQADGGITMQHLNGIDLLQDVVFLGGREDGSPQLISAPKYFSSTVHANEVNTDGNIHINGTINGYNLNEVLSNSVLKSDSVDGIYIKGNLHFNNSLDVRGLYVDKYLNGIYISEFLKKVIYLNEPGELLFPVIVYGGQVRIETLATVASINNISVAGFLSQVVLINEEPNFRINGTKTFKNVAFDSIECVEFNRINIQEMKDSALLRSEPQNITGKMYFSNVKLEDYGTNTLTTPEIGGIPVDLFITTRIEDPCEINFDVRFVGKRITVDGALRVKSLNGYRVEEISSGYDKGLGNRTFQSVEVQGNVEWLTEIPDSYHKLGSLSKLLEKAVTLDDDQTITGKVEFLGGIEAEELDTGYWINGIDFSKLIADSFNPDELDEFTFLGNNVFTRPIKIDKYTSIEKLQVTTVNGVNLIELDKLAVRRVSRGIIYGTKTFLNEVSVENLTFQDLMKQGDLKDLVVEGDDRVIDEAEFEDITVSGDLNFISSTRLNLHSLLQHRVSKTKEQTLHGNYTFSSLNINGTCYPKVINGIPVKDIYINKPDQPPQHIQGEKNFLNGVYVKGEVKAGDVNGYNFAALHSDVYRRNEPEKLNRPIVFMSPVVIDAKIKVEKKINNYDYHILSDRFSKALKDIEVRATNYTSFGRSQFEKFEQLQQLMTTQKSFWLEYLRLVEGQGEQNPKLGPAARIEQTETEDGILLALYNRISADNSSSYKYLPRGCYCNKVEFVLFKYNSLHDTETRTAMCTSQFVVSTPSGNVFTVKDDGISYNRTCSTISSTPRLTIALGTDVGMVIPGSELLTDKSGGFLVDVDAFSAKGVDYIVLAYTYPDHRRYQHPGGQLEIYEINNGTASKIQTIKGVSPNRIAVDEFQYSWILSVAGSEKPSALCNSTSSIYIWSTTTNKFDILRDLKTEGATDVTFLSLEDLSITGKNLSFIAFAQEITGVESRGEVVIYSYNFELGNYVASEILRFKWPVSAVDSTCIMEECYVLVVVPQEGVYFYKYQYIEGFQKYLSVPVKDIYDITPFVLHHRLFYALAGVPSSLLAEGQIAGVDYFK